MKTTQNGTPRADHPLAPGLGVALALLGMVTSASAQFPQTNLAALVRHAPNLNGNGRIEGSAQQLLGEAVTLNGGFEVTGDLLVPGMPTTRVNGHPDFGGTVVGSGNASPSGYRVTLNGNCSLRYLRTRTDPVSLPTAAVPPAPTGTRSVTINASGQPIGDPATLRHLTLNGSVGQIAVPPGTYGYFIANGGSGFILGVAGASAPVAYNLQNLALNGQAHLEIVGPVILTVANGFAANGVLGATSQPAWLQLQIASGGLTLNGGCTVHGNVTAPAGTIILNGNSELIGRVQCDRLTFNGGGLIRAGNAPNQPPVADSQDVTVAEDGVLAVTLAGRDPEGATQVFTVLSPPAHGGLSGEAPNLVYVPATNFNGDDSFTFKVNDGQADSAAATVSIAVTAANDPPTAQPLDLSVAEDAPLEITLLGADVENAALTFVVATPSSHGELTLDSARPDCFIYTPSGNYNGADSFTYRVGDGQAWSEPATVSLAVQSVDDAPVANAQAVSGNEDGPLAITLTGGDIEGETLFFTVLTQPTNGVLSGVEPDLIFTPGTNFHGADSFAFLVSDSLLDSEPASVSIIVRPVNDPPVAQCLTLVTPEDTATNLVLTAGDVEGDALNFTLLSSVANGTLTGTAPELVFSPAADYHGTNVFEFVATDSQDTSAPVVVTLIVTLVNDAPVADAQALVLDEDTPLPVTLRGVDVDGDVLTFAVVTPPTNGTLSGTVPNLVYTPATNCHGTDYFTFKANDGALDSAEATVSLTVAPVNDAPVAEVQTVELNEDTSLEILLAGTDVDGDRPTYLVATPPSHGRLSGTPPNLTYQPNSDYHGADSFEFVAEDGRTQSAPAAVTITVQPVNDAPVATGQNLGTAEDEPVRGTVTASDADGDALTFVITSQGMKGVLVMNADGTFIYTPAVNANGLDAFTFVANDGQTSSAPTTVTVAVTPVNDAPVATDLGFANMEDGPMTITLSATDAEHDPLTFTVASWPTNGVLTGEAPHLVYIPATNFWGADALSYSVSDGAALSGVAWVTISNAPVNDAPGMTVPGDQTVTAGGRIVFGPDRPITIEDVDVGSNLLQLSAFVTSGRLAWGATNGLVWLGEVDNPTNLVVAGTLSDLSAALNGLTYVATGGSASELITLTVDDLGNSGTGGSLTDTQTIRVSVATPAPASVPTTTGTNFWVGRLAGTEVYRMRYLMLLSERDASVILTSPDGSPELLELEAGMPFEWWLEGLGSWDPIPPSDTILRTAYHVASSEPISVFMVDFAPNDSDAYRILPTPMLGTNYVVAAWRNSQMSPESVFGSQFSVTAVEDETVVNIVPAASTSGHAAGQPFTVILQEGETYNLRHTETADGDLTGSIVTADKPVAVLGGAAWATIPTGAGCGSLVAEQLLPIELWDREYVVLRLADRPAFAVRILAAQDGTEVQLPGFSRTNLNRGEFWELYVTNEIQVVASKPVAVCQYALGDQPGNPAMLWVPGVHQGLADFDWMTPETYMTLFFGRIHPADLVYTNYVNLVLPSGALPSLTINAVTFGEYGDLFWNGEWNRQTICGSALPADSSLRALGDGQYVGVCLPVANGIYRFHCSEPVLLVSYGFLAQPDAYGPDTYALPGPFSAPRLPSSVRVSVVSPTNGSVVLVGAETPVIATLADPRRVVTNLQFCLDGVVLSGNVATNLVWTPVLSGSHALHFVAATLTGESVTSAPVHVTAVADFTSEGVQIVSPNEGESVYVNRPMPIALAFADPLGSFDHAEFFANEISLGQTTNTTLTWTPPQTNDYILTATVFDRTGRAFDATNPVTVHVIPPPPPGLMITSPVEGSRVRAGFDTFVVASLDDPGQLTTNVEFYVDGVRVSENATYFAWTPTQLGRHGLHCVALTSEGDHITSAAINVTVVEMFPPAVVLSSPTNDQRFVSNVLPLLTAQATDSDGSVSNLTLTVDYTTLAETNGSLLELLATNVAPGWHEVVAQATDNDGLNSTSESVRFFVERQEDPTLPVPEALAAAALSPAEIRLSWSPIITNALIRFIFVERWDTDRSLWGEVAEVSVTSTEYFDSDLSPETHYRYRIACAGTNGHRSAYSAEVAATTRTLVPNYAVIDLTESIVGLLTNRLPSGNALTNAGLTHYDSRRTIPSVIRHANEVLGTNVGALTRAVARFKERWPQIQLDYDPVLLSPSSVMPRVGFLTGPGGLGVTVSEDVAQRFDPSDPDRPIKAFLQEHQVLFGFGAEAVSNAVVQRTYVAAGTGMRTVVWQQQVAGVPVFNGLLMGHVTAAGELASVSSEFIPSPERAATPAGMALVESGAELPLAGSAALLTAVTNIGDLCDPGDINGQGSAQGITRLQTFSVTKGGKADAHAELTWFPASRNELRLAWQVIFTSQWRNEMYLTLVSAETGEILYRRNLTTASTAASYRVYAANSPSPMSPGWLIPDWTQPSVVDRSLMTLAALDDEASPGGWITDGDNETRGNNVDAHLDRNDDNLADLPRPTGNPSRVFDFTLDLSGSPSGYGDAATVQLFYWNNWMHDALHGLGFTEAAGNFQDDNFGRGGLGGDAVQADAQDGWSLNDGRHHDNANMSTPPDGYSPRMQMFVFDGAEPDRDGSLDAEIILHEYTHGLSGRMVGGGAGIDAVQTGGMGEGWSDFYALALLADPTADVDAAYPVGAYAAYHGFGTQFAQNYYYGLRRYPYCTDTNKNPLTFVDIDPIQAREHPGVPRNPLTGPFRVAMASEVHHQGEVWCQMLWEMRASLIQKHGHAQGNNLALQLVTDGMKLSPPNPNFVQSRDAILLADRIWTRGANAPEIWAAFAKRGLGHNAKCPVSYTSLGVRESYQPAPALVTERVEIQGGNDNGTIEANEDNNLLVVVHNQGNATGTQVSGRLFATTPGVAALQEVSSYPDIPQNESRGNAVWLQVRTAPEFVEGTAIDLVFVIASDQVTTTNYLRLFTGTPGTEILFDNFSALPGASSGPVRLRDLTPWDLGHLEPLWMAEDASCLLSSGPGHYVLWHPTREPEALVDGTFLAHRLTRNGVVVGHVALPNVDDQFGNELPQMAAARWLSGAASPTLTTPDLYAYRYPKGAGMYEIVGAAFSTNNSVATNYFVGAVNRHYPVNLSWWDENASGQAVGATAVYMTPYDWNNNGLLDVYLQPRPDGELEYRNEVVANTTERIVFDTLGRIGWLEFTERGFSTRVPEPQGLTLYYNALSCSAARFEANADWRWLGPMKSPEAGASGEGASVGLLLGDDGTVVGCGRTRTGDVFLDAHAPTHAFRWQAEAGEYDLHTPRLTDLGTLPTGAHSYPRAMNSGGCVVGYSDLDQMGAGGWAAVYWGPTNTRPERLSALAIAPPAGFPNGFSDAFAINDQTNIVGIALGTNGDPRGVLWQWNANEGGGTAFWEVTDLNDRLANPQEWRVQQAVGINSKGWMLARALNQQSQTRAVLLVPVRMAVDGNRDGQIAFAGADDTTAQKPYRFWLNDDDDTHGITRTRFGPDGKVTSIENTETLPASSPDYAEHCIVTARNLEDFSRLWIDLTGLQSLITRTDGIQVGLKWKSFTGAPAVDLYISADASGSDSYLRNSQAAFDQISTFTCNRAITFVNNRESVTTSGTFVFRTDMLRTQLQRSPVLHLLFEGAGVGKGQIALVLLRSDGTEIGEGTGVWLDLMNIKSMYERAVATTGGPRSENGIDYTIPIPSDLTGPDDNNIPHPTMGWDANPLGYPYQPDPAETKTYIVFVHGWRWSPEKANNRTETVFKRLWHLGYKGRLTALRWPTFYGGPDDDDGALAGLLTYNNSEYRAWKSGESLKLYVNQLPSGYARHIVAHSMGNIVAGSALKTGMSVANYIMLNAAVPAMCYDESTSLRQTDWNYTTPNVDSDAGTRALAYIGQFRTLNTRVVNFFLNRDSATRGAWELNNRWCRPQRYNVRTTGYAYDPAEIPGRRLYVTFFSSRSRHLIDPHEAMPYACQSLTRTAGADGRTRGSIGGAVDMDASFGFGAEHGAEWDWNCQPTRAFYVQLMRALQLPVQP